MYENEIEEISLKCNKLAMDYLRADKLKDSLTLLQRAELLLTSENPIPNRLKLLALTFNNLGCYYKKKKQPTVALKYLKESLSLEMQTEADGVNVAGTHLNICAILSSVGRHDQAYTHARQSLAILEQHTQFSPSLITNLVISYYNCGTELEFLLQLEEALRYYELGLQIAVKEFGDAHQLTKNLYEIVKKVSGKVSKCTSDAKNHRETRHRGYKSIDAIKERLPNILSGRNRKSLSNTRRNRLNRTMGAISKYNKSLDV